jgi:hypothetical protein
LGTRPTPPSGKKVQLGQEVSVSVHIFISEITTQFSMKSVIGMVVDEHAHQSYRKNLILVLIIAT